VITAVKKQKKEIITANEMGREVQRPKCPSSLEAIDHFIKI